MLYSSSPIEDIKSRIDIVDLISDYVKLSNAGANLKALCPFHREKSPSFMVSREKQIWHCFGCDEGGDVLGFFMRMEGIEFFEALRILAQKANVELRPLTPESKKTQNRRTRLIEAHEKAVQLYRDALTSASGTQAREYLKKRKLKQNTINEFLIGWSPDSYDYLLAALSKTFTRKELADAGLIVLRQDGSAFDRFRGRIMFPLKNHNDQIVGFTGRILDESNKKVGKYVNTPETIIYQKGKLFYALEKAKTDIRRMKYAIIVEGQMDVIASHEAGIKNTIGSSGTALTDDQLLLLKRFTQNILLAFDSDDAGEEAAKRGIERAIVHGFNIKVIQTPGDKDPDECIRKDKKSWIKAIKHAKLIMDYYFDVILGNIDLENIVQKKEAARELLAIISNIQDKIEQSHYIHKLSEKIQVSESTLFEMVEKFKQNTQPHDRSQAISPATKNRTQKRIASVIAVEQEILGFIMKFPALIPDVLKELRVNHLSHKTHQSIYSFLKTYYSNKKSVFIVRDFQRALEQKDKKLVHEIDVLLLRIDSQCELDIKGEEYDGFEELDEEHARIEIHSLIRRLKTYRARKLLHQLELSMKDAERKNDEKLLKKLSADFDVLASELSHLLQ